MGVAAPTRFCEDIKYNGIIIPENIPKKNYELIFKPKVFTHICLTCFNVFSG